MTHTSRLAPLAADWLDENVDSHGIYEVTILATLPEGITFEGDNLRAEGRACHLGTMTASALDNQQGAEKTGNPKGAYLDPKVAPDTRLFGGYWLASALDRLLTGEDAGAMYMGRGSSHRANVAHLRGCGEPVVLVTADGDLTLEGAAYLLGESLD